MKDRKNTAEREFELKMIEEGYEVTKRGWPDFICWRDGEPIFVEVKPGNKSLKEEQLRLAEYLREECGLQVYRWSPSTGFTYPDGGYMLDDKKPVKEKGI